MASTSDRERFDAAVSEGIARFPDSRLVRRLERGDLEMTHYQALLTTLFHQSYAGPYTFARAAVNCSWRHEIAKEYLLHHAEEEKTHWRWILSDLAATGYAGPDPRYQPPQLACQAYVGLNYYMAEVAPVARIAIACVLEGIGATHGGRYGRKLLQTLGLRAEQASFILNHGETDQAHAVDLARVLAETSLSPEEWSWMASAATAAGTLYRGMYDHEAYA